jgi:hypothetical protein
VPSHSILPTAKEKILLENGKDFYMNRVNGRYYTAVFL